MDIRTLLELSLWIMTVGVVAIVVGVVQEIRTGKKFWDLVMKIFPTVVAVGAILFGWAITKI